ncbi:putative ribonuclease H-like domain-containing protein, partial [Tanacetum coccineum]
VTAKGMHAVPPLMTENYMPSGPDIEIDYSQFIYGPKQIQTSESKTQTSDFETCESDSSDYSVETHESLPEPAVNKPKVVDQPKVWSDAPIIKEYESDSEDEHVSLPTEKQETPSFANQQVKTHRETVKNQFTHSKNPKVDKKGIRKKSSQREIRLIWNNVQRVNHKNQFVPTAVLTRTGKIPVSTARASGTNNVSTTRHNFNSQNKGIIDSRCYRHMTGNKAYLAEYQDFNGGPIAFRGIKGYITGKENKVLFTDTECLVLSPDFKLPDENQVLLRIPRQNNMYSFNLESILPFRGLACLIAKAIIDESNKWHRRLGHVNFKNLNKLVKGNLVRGLPSMIFQNDHTCVACQKGKQHKASCKAKLVRSISQPLQLLHMDLFAPTSVRSLSHKTYCLVITDDFSRFSWVFFLRTKDETSGILKEFIRKIENQLNQKVKTIRCDNGTEFKNRDVIELYGSKGIKREYRKGPTWLFDLDYLTDSMNYQPLRSENQANKHAGPQESNQNAGTKENINAGDSPIEAESAQDYFVLSIWSSYTSTVKSSKARVAKAGSTNIVNTASTPISTASPYDGLSFTDLTNTDQDDSEIPALEEIYDNPTAGIFTNASYDDEGAVADFTNLETVVNVSPIPTSRINSIHPSTLILRDPKSAVQTRSKVTKSSGAHAFVSYIQKQRRNNHKDFQHCLFACFLSQNEPKKISEALEDESWVDAMQEELLQFKIQKIWILVDLPYRKKAIRTKWVYRNKKDERGVVVRNKARLVAQGHRQEEGIDYDKVFAPVARIEAIRVFLAFASYMGFIVYQMDVKSAFLYGKIDEDVYVSQPPGFIDLNFPKKVYKVVKALYGLHQAPRACVKTASTPIETQKPLVKDEEASDVDVYLYRSMIGSLMYLTASRPDIMFAVCACSRFQVNPKISHLSDVKRIFRYLKGKPKLCLWYPRVSSFDLEAYSDSDYAGANLDRKSTIGGCQFLGRRLISWQCKKQTIVATSTTEAEYVAAAN